MGALKRFRRAWRAFQAAQSDPQHAARPVGSQQSPDSAMEMANTNLRQWARHLDENHDLAIGVIDDLVTNVVGTGIVVAPMPQIAGRVRPEIGEQILELWDDWGRAPEVTAQLPWSELQRITCRSWLRDGEFFAQHVQPPSTYPWGDGPVRYRVEYLEADMVPMDDWVANRGGGDPRQGVYMDAWNRPYAYAVYLRNPYDTVRNNTGLGSETKRVPVELMMHVKFARRWPQTRGVPICHGIIRRLQDLKEYEESERIAARVAASMCAYIRRSPDADTPQDITTNISGERQMAMQSGQIFTDLLQGEEIGTIDTSRPSSELANFRESQMRALAAGTGTRYSSIARDYSGTYAAQRQEMVEARPHYLRLREYYVQRFIRPVYERFLRVAWLTGRLRVPPDMEFSDLARAEFIGPGMPWIDPLKEVQAHVIAINNSLKTREQIIRANGDDPRNIRETAPRTNLEVVEDAETEDQSDTGTP